MLQQLQRVAASNRFFYAVVAVFTVSSLWIAISSSFPLAFDEEVHYGMTQIYASQPLPWAVEQTEAANAYGSITTDPSYLYYLLLSIPYRLVHLVTDSTVAIITSLRVINIGLVVLALFVFRRLLVRLSVSTSASHLVLALFTLIPVMPLLAGQINYDNLLLVTVPLLFIYVLQLREDVAKGSLPITSTFVVLLLILFGSLVKHPFLPIAVVAGLYSLVIIWRAGRSTPKFWANTRANLRTVSRPLLIIVILLVLLGVGLVGQRYGRNVVVYRDVVPACDVVLTVEQCSAWGPWRRDYNLEHSKPANAEVRNVLHYSATHWAWGMWNRIFFTLAEPGNSYDTKQRLPIISYSFIVIGAIGVLAVLVNIRAILRCYPGFTVILLAAGLYTVVLIAQQYGMYAKTAQPVAINGRYLLLFLPLFAGIIAVGYQDLFAKLKRQAVLPVLGLVTLLLFTQGGGITTYLIRSESNWLYQNQMIQDTAHDLKTISKFLVIGD